MAERLQLVESGLMQAQLSATARRCCNCLPPRFAAYNFDLNASKQPSLQKEPQARYALGVTQSLLTQASSTKRRGIKGLGDAVRIEPIKSKVGFEIICEYHALAFLSLFDWVGRSTHPWIGFAAFALRPLLRN